MKAEEIRKKADIFSAAVRDQDSVDAGRLIIAAGQLDIAVEIAAQLEELNSFFRWFTDKFTSNGCIDIKDQSR